METIRYEGDGWSILLAKGWDGGCSEGPHSFTNEARGVGALQISGAVRELGGVPEEQMRGLVTHMEGGPQDAAWKRVKLNEFAGWYIERLDGEKFWRRWYLWNQGMMLLVTYNCSVEHRARERAAVDRMVRSLAITGRLN